MSFSPADNAAFCSSSVTGVQHASLPAQDLSRLGRDLNRTVLVDDTPLAFLRQPDNGIPIFNFRYGPSSAASNWPSCVSCTAWMAGEGAKGALLLRQENALRGCCCRVEEWTHVEVAPVQG